MIRHGEALALLRDAGHAHAQARTFTEEVPLSAALGRVAAVALTSREPIPPFDNSAMDGYALAAAKGAKAPARLTVLGTVLAGDKPRCAVESGGAWRIMTGAPIPAGCDAVIPVEKTRALDGGREVELLEPVEAGDYVRGQGRDFPAGAEVCPAGTRLGARHLLALAAVGLVNIPVRRKPRIALLSTGRELVSPEAALAPGQIRDASSTYLAAAVPALGTVFKFDGTVADDPADFKRRLERILQSGVDVVLTTGAVSMGDADFIPMTLKAMGAEVVFHKVAIRPGKPVFFARFSNGPLFFGLPGNPISTVVGLRFFVEPCLREMMGRPVEMPTRARLSADVDKPEGLRCFFKARRCHDGKIEILPGQASFQIHSLLAADCWGVLPEEGERLEAGTEIDVYPMAESLA
jgi:molybdopterin molybdotransferase